MSRWDKTRLLEWAERWAQIQDPMGGVIDFRANPIQIRFHEGSDALAGEPGVWDGVVKGRQCGISTFVMLMITAIAIEYPGTSMLAVVANEDELIEVIDKFRLIQHGLMERPESGHPGASHDNLDKYHWKNGSRLRWYAVGGAEGTAKKVGRGGTYALCWLTETAFPARPELMALAIEALRPALTKARSSIIVDSSPDDPDGNGRVYAELIASIREGSTRGRVHFFAWFEDPDNARDLPSTPERFAATLDDEERALIRRFGLTFEQLQFRRELLVKPDLTPTQARRKFGWQYPATIEEAFRRGDEGSGVVDAEALERITLTIHTGPPPLDVSAIKGAPLLGLLDLMRAHRWGSDTSRSGYVRIWRTPAQARGVEHHRWCHFIGVDGSLGRPDSDWQSATMIDRSGHLCAEVRVKIKEGRFAALVQRLASWFDAMIIVERQRGELIHDRIRHPQGATQIEEVETFPGECAVLRRGYPHVRLDPTTRTTRPQIVSGALALIEDVGSVRSPEALAELHTLERTSTPTGERIAAREIKGAHDDAFMSLGLAAYLRTDQLARGKRQRVEEVMRRVKPRVTRRKYAYFKRRS